MIREKESLFIREVLIDWNDIESDSYLRSIEALKDRGRIVFESPVTFFAGENGSGKSTLLEAIAIAYGLNPEGGNRNYAFHTYDSCSDLHEHMTLVKNGSLPRSSYFLRAETFYNVATMEMEYAEDRSLRLHDRSHGESFLRLIKNRFRGDGLYILDEPEAALSAQNQLTLLLCMEECVKAGSQFIIATHSPIIMAYPDAQILDLDDHLQTIAYEDTDAFRIYRLFISDRKRMLKRLFDEKE